MNKIFIYLFGCLALFSPLAAQSPIIEERTQEALEKGYEDLEENDEFYSELMNVVFILAFILFAMIVAAYYMRKFMQGRVEQINETSNIKVLEQRNLSAKTVLYVVEAHGKKVLVGESVAGVVGLGEITNSRKSFDEIYEQSSPKE